MGEVYRAEDTTLKRYVALKVLPPETAGDPDRLRCFRREVEAVAALNHPNIVVIHSVEAADGVHVFTMELVEGETLERVIHREGLPLGRLLDLAIPLADALAAAHERGMVHRDLKPGNIMVTVDGRFTDNNRGPRGCAIRLAPPARIPSWPGAQAAPTKRPKIRLQSRPPAPPPSSPASHGEPQPEDDDIN